MRSLFPPLLATLFLLYLAVLPTVEAAPPAQQSLDSIRDTASHYLLSAAEARHSGRVDVSLGRLDPRLRLSACEQPLEAFQPAGSRLSGHTSVGVRCPGVGGWSVYVTAEIALYADALVAVRPLARGQAIHAADVQLRETNIARYNGAYLSSLDEIEGLVARRPIAHGMVLNPSLIKAPRLVRRGDRVTLVNANGPIRVEMQGEAMSDGAKGERVRVRTLNSRQIVDGWVESASVIKVTL